jgi:hypothetical protein
MMPRLFFIKSGADVSQFGGAHLRMAFGIQLFERAPITALSSTPKKSSTMCKQRLGADNYSDRGGSEAYRCRLRRSDRTRDRLIKNEIHNVYLLW